MKSIVLVAAGFTALSSGCASIPDGPVSQYGNVDTQRVAAVNNAARGRGVTVHWLSYPELKAPPTNVVPSLGEPSGT
jgi:hypothetical protein